MRSNACISQRVFGSFAISVACFKAGSLREDRYFSKAAFHAQAEPQYEMFSDNVR